jgi:hypothetical protein
MLLNDERRLLYWLGKDYYSGTGEIIDGGSFLGGSFQALACGLHDGGHEDSRIHCYDNFVTNQYMLNSYPEALKGIRLNESFRPAFEALTARYEANRCIHEGEMGDQEWSGKPIEILFLDILKTWHVNDVVTERFFPSLIGGRGVIVHQDYIHAWCPWIHITMEMLRDFVQLTDVVATSVVFLVKKNIPASMALRCKERSISHADQMALMNRSIARFRGTARGVLNCCKARLLYFQGKNDAAKALLLATRKHFHDDEHVVWCAQEILEFAGH